MCLGLRFGDFPTFIKIQGPHSRVPMRVRAPISSSLVLPAKSCIYPWNPKP